MGNRLTHSFLQNLSEHSTRPENAMQFLLGSGTTSSTRVREHCHGQENLQTTVLLPNIESGGKHNSLSHNQHYY